METVLTESWIKLSLKAFVQSRYKSVQNSGTFYKPYMTMQGFLLSCFSITARNRRSFQQLRIANPSGIPLFLLLLYYYYYCTKLDILLHVLDYIAGLVTNEHIITAINCNPSDCLSHSFERTPLQSVNLPVYHKSQRDTDSKIGERGLDADYLLL